MSEGEKRALIALPIVLLIGTGLAFAGSQRSTQFDGFPVFAICIIFAFIIQWLALFLAVVFLAKTVVFLCVLWHNGRTD